MNTTPQAQPTTLLERLKQSSHPIALLFFLGFRLGSLTMYLLGVFLTGNFILEFIVVILLLAADFWNVKNVLGRLLVGLRWWNETSEEGDTVWVFETADPDRYINPIDSNVFWTMMYVSPVLWIVFAIIAILKFEFLSLILVGIAVILNITNTLAFTKCDKFGKANNLTSSILGSAFSRMNPFAAFF
ncbi:hypothetical protein BABINDRAFT_172605 [Babjeviella inositovora NRRL Y-12698]|uniref:Golgi apparatus membrane protein TVP23 n=1 Tax=Babjeviella inositovora NRRL Y-12698 TaxID=984486 RepID=A0A1E3QJE5_9ASCO|nr:uncharacterized protein BABINDRAFT_172605 [Babjeviella inositovora NRRL Y-12698]ODQ77826.1 hypothetical protein BABINDRAFT_172605 [Babjeviella inositovora NRRL Y-12698]